MILLSALKRPTSVVASGASVFTIRLNRLALPDSKQRVPQFMTTVQQLTTDSDLIIEQTKDGHECLTPQSD